MNRKCIQNVFLCCVSVILSIVVCDLYVLSCVAIYNCVTSLFIKCSLVVVWVIGTPVLVSLFSRYVFNILKNHRNVVTGRRISNSSLRVTQSCLQPSTRQDSEETEEAIPMEDCEIIELSDVDERSEVDSQWQSVRHMLVLARSQYSSLLAGTGNIVSSILETQDHRVQEENYTGTQQEAGGWDIIEMSEVTENETELPSYDIAEVEDLPAYTDLGTRRVQIGRNVIVVDKKLQVSTYKT